MKNHLLLPLLLISEIAVALEYSQETSAIFQRPCEDAHSGLVPPEIDAADSFADPWWSQILGYIPPFYSKTSSNNLIDDLRLAFLGSTPSYVYSSADDADQCTLQKRAMLVDTSNIDPQRVLTRCKVRQKPGPHRSGEGASSTVNPNYTPTGTDGRPLPTQTIGDGHGGSGSEIIAVTTKCGDITVGATINSQTTTGPNGQEKWLTCGIDPHNNSSGWQPPYATIDQIITYSGGLQAAVKVNGSPFQACANYVQLFETAGSEFGIPPFFIASFALQESGCNPDIDGQGGEQGMMQISPEKCKNAPNGDCKDVVYNVRTAISYFKDVLNSANGNVFEAVGSYNGWNRNMTYANAVTWGVAGNCCHCQRNLDYLQQFFNGWLQNLNAWDLRLGQFWNVETCPD